MSIEASAHRYVNTNTVPDDADGSVTNGDGGPSNSNAVALMGSSPA
jgi:hypothetical protein